MRLIMRFSVILLALACVPAISHATQVNLTSSTQYLWFHDFIADKYQNDVAQYLRLNMTKLDKEGKVSIFGYGRVSEQITSSEDVRGRLYYLYVDYRDAIKDHLDLRLGRTYINAAAVSGTVDGLHLDFKNLGPIGVTAFGGREVIFQNKGEIGGGNALVGGSIYIDAPKYTHAELSYGIKYRAGVLARETVALDFSTTPIDMVNAYGKVKFDTLADEFNELLFGLRLAPLKNLFLKLEYYQNRPTFDNNSIYTIFAVHRFNELSACAEYQITSDYRLNMKYAKEYFGDNAEANVYNVGLFARPIKDLSLNASYENRTGYAGQLSGFRVNAGYDINKAKIMAGIDYDDFTREDSRDSSAKKYWGSMSYQFNKMFAVTARVEDDVNFLENDNLQGFAAINVNY